MSAEQVWTVDGEEVSPFDPRDFTVAEWNVIIKSLRHHADWLMSIGYRRGGTARDEAFAAADRHRELCSKAIGAKVFCREHKEES